MAISAPLRTSAVLLLACCFVLTTSGTPAPKPNIFGTYEGYMGELTLAPRAGKIHLEFLIGIPGCTGSIEGDGKLEKNVFTYSVPVEGQDDPCVLTITFDRRNATVASEHCSYFHGATCEFDGKYRRTRK
jgi:hypothetical protein